MDKIDNNKKLGGMLIIGVLSIAFSAIISFTSITKAVLPLNINSTWMAISNLSLDTYNQPWMRFVFFKFSSSIFILILSIVLVILFIKQSKRFPMALIIFFMVRILLLAFIFYYQTIIKGPATPNLSEIVSSVFRALVITGVWIPYIMLSEKARETFIY